MPKIEGYVGICRVCFEPIEEGTEVEKEDLFYHKDCIKVE